MKMVVTGGAGFIGFHLVNRLVSQGYEVHVIDNLTTGDPARLNFEAILHVADIGSDQATSLIRLLKPDVVFHLAAQADVQQSIKSPVNDADANIMGTLHLLEACRTANVRKVVFASTAGVYGNLHKKLLTEIDPANPVSFFALSKLTAEHYIALYHQYYGLDYTILRYGNVYGPNQTPKGEGGVVAVFKDRITNGLPLNVYGDGSQTRDFIFVNDVVEANVAAIHQGQGNTFNVSTSQPTSVNRLIEIIRSQCTQPIEVNYLPAKPGDIMHSCLDNKKICSKLPWKSKYSVEGGLTETFRSWNMTPDR